MKCWKLGDRMGAMPGLLFVLLSAIASFGVLTGASAQTLKTLYSFSGGADGNQPFAGLISDAKGALYGTTAVGGAYNQGAVYKLTPSSVSGGPWTETVLYSFTGGSDGGGPNAGLVSDGSGALYGTTLNGGINNQGTAFELTPHNPANPNSCQVAYNYNLTSCNANWGPTTHIVTPPMVLVIITTTINFQFVSIHQVRLSTCAYPPPMMRPCYIASMAATEQSPMPG
jgi:uncharacterized repeat protein (TIGR03803 family)